MTRYNRKNWGAKPALSGPGKLDKDQVGGIVIHWPAMSKPMKTVKEVMAGLRSWQEYHMSKGWSDIAYQEAIDQMGNSYVLRGFRTQSAANGDEDVNDEWGAILLILAPGEEPSAAMMKTARSRISRFREIYPKGRKIRGHNEVRPEPTQCPGKIVIGMIQDGSFNAVRPIRKPK